MAERPSDDRDGDGGDDHAGDRRHGDGRANRYHHLVEHIQDAVVEFELVDGEPIVESVNSAFVEVFGYDPADLVGDSLNDWIVPEWHRAEARTLDGRTAAGEVNYQRVRRETTDGLREFLYRGIPYGDGAATTDGFAVYTDLTEISRTERRLEVMNRVMRHNLRNEANVILGHTSRLLDALPTATDELTGSAAAVERAAHDLQALTEEAADIQRILGDRSVDDGVDCVPLVRAVANDHRRQSPAARILTDLPASMSVNADETLRYAIDGLVENAIEHNPASTPTVRIRVGEADAVDWIALHVDDDGPPIPAHERTVITGETEITPTRHGTGLGLWLVKWTTDAFGGELSFATSDLGGNTVSIRLPVGEGPARP